MTNTKPRVILTIACSIYLIFGMFTAGIGPVLQELAQQTGSTLAAVGSVLTFLFLGAVVAQIVAGPLTDRFGQRLILIVSLLLMAAGLTGFTTAQSLPVMLGLVFITGLGQGGVDLGGNLIVSDAYPTNNTSVLNLLHFFFGAGAFIGPALVSLAITQTGSGLVVHWIASAAFVLLAVAIFSLVQKPSKKTGAGTAAIEVTPIKSVYLSPFLWIAGLFLLIYVGIEWGAGSWVTTYMTKTTQMLVQNGALVTSVYWGALTLGRLAGAGVSRKLSKFQLLSAAVIGSLIGMIGLLIVVGNSILTIIIIGIFGFFMGATYPTAVAITISVFPNHQGKAVGLLTAMASIGGLAIPWLAGVTLENISPMAYVIFLSIIAGLDLLLLYVLYRLYKRTSSPSQ